MKNPIIYIKNGIRNLALKAMHGSRLRIGWIQSFENVRLQISRKGSVEIGSYNQNRGNMYVGVIESGKLSIGSHCFFNVNTSITCMEKIEIGDYCKFGNNLVIVDHDHNYVVKGDYTKDSPEFLSTPITIGNNVWVGANVVILRGTTIGDNSVIAAGSVVKGLVPSNTVFVKQKMRSY